MLKAILFVLFGLIFAPKVIAVAPDNYRWVERNNGISGTTIVGAAISTTATTMYVLTSTRGIYKSTDGGATWASANTGLPTNLTVGSSNIYSNLLTMDPNDSTVLYVNIGGVLYKTTDGGSNWTNISSGITLSCGENAMVGVTVDKTNSSHLIAGTVVSGCSGGLFESTNGGTSWTQIAGLAVNGSTTIGGYGNNDAWVNAIDPTDVTKLYFSSVHGEGYYSTNSGSSWTKMTLPVAYGTEYSGTGIAINSSDHSVLLATNLGLVRSTDYGTTWSDVATFSDLAISAVAFTPSDPTIAYVLVSGKVYQSTDSGVTWNLRSNTASVTWGSLAIDAADPQKLLLGTSGNGVYLSSNGGTTVTQSNSGLPTIITGKWLTSVGSNIIAGITGQGLFKSADKGINWTEIWSASAPQYIDIAPSNTNIAFAGVANSNAIIKSTDAGLNWSSVNSNAVRTVAVSPSDPNIIVAGITKTIYRTTDGGTVWSSFTPAAMAAITSINQIVFDPADGNNVYCWTVGGGVFKSTDAGATWSASSTGIPGGDNWIDFGAISPSNSQIIYVSSRGAAIYKTIDGGANWSAVSALPSASEAYNFYIDPTDSNLVYASDYNIGWYKSTNGGTTWSTLSNTGLPSSTGLFAFVRDSSDANRFIATTPSNGVYAFENYIPKFETSTFSFTAPSADGVINPGDIITFTFVLKNTGVAQATNPKVVFVIPDNVSLVPNSVKIDGVAVNPDPISGTTVTVNTVNVSSGENLNITFQLKINDGFTGNLVVDPVVTSDEDVSGTTITALNLTSTKSTSLGIDFSGDRFKPLGWICKIDAGPHFPELEKFITESINPSGAKIYIGKSAHHNDVCIDIKRLSDFTKIKAPWLQGLRVVGNVFEIVALASFNGYRETNFDHPVTVVMPFDRNLAQGKTNLKLAIYDDVIRRWIVLKSNNVINWQQATVANTTKKVTSFTVVY